jgi:hypothetical protein
VSLSITAAAAAAKMAVETARQMHHATITSFRLKEIFAELDRNIEWRTQTVCWGK